MQVQPTSVWNNGKGQETTQADVPVVAFAVMFTTTLMFGSIFVVCSLLSELEAADVKAHRANSRASESAELAATGQDPGSNQDSPPPAAMNQCWMESGIVIDVSRISYKYSHITSRFVLARFVNPKIQTNLMETHVKGQ